MKKLLIVDDSAVMRKNLRSILSEAGYDVVAEATNGDEGVRFYKEHRPDLVTMDVTMPVMGGIDAVKAIVAYDPRAVILVVSAFDRRSALFEAMDRGAKHYIIKPITRDKLLGAVEKLIGGGKSDAEVPSVAATAETAAAASQPVEIENRSGTFYVVLTEKTTVAALEAIRPALQGLLFIKPLRLAMDFGALSSAAPELLRLAGELLEPAVRAGGDARLLARDPALLAELQRLHPHLAVDADA